MLKLTHGLGLDLPHPLAGDVEPEADLLQGVGTPVAQTVPEVYDLLLPKRQGAEDLVDPVLQHFLGGYGDR